jgi:hypothetical protein
VPYLIILEALKLAGISETLATNLKNVPIKKALNLTTKGSGFKIR